MNMNSNIEWGRPSGAWIGVLLATRRRRRMRRHPSPTFVFADLVGYTALTETRGDSAAAHVATEFRRTMNTLSREHGGWQVKSMGDSVMIWLPDPIRAVALAAHTLQDVGTRDDLLPVRVGVHTGPAVMCGWDWYGNAVNVAARLACEAGPNEALISATSHTFASSELSLRLGRRRELHLRGLEHPVVASCLITRLTDQPPV
jgi:adenylate cyclase